MAITLVQSATATGNTSISLAYGSAVTPGNVLICAFGASNPARTITGVLDNQFGNWTSAISSQVKTIAAIFYLPTAASSSVTPTVTATLNGASAMALTIMEWSGLAPLVDQTGHNNSGIATTNSTVSTSSATTNPTELVLACIGTNVGQTYTAGSGFTLIGAINGVHSAEYLTTNSTGTQTATMSWASSASWDMEIATFFPVVTTAPVTTRRYVHYYI